MATYGEGEPTDNAVQLMQNLSDESFEFSKGEHKLDGLKYVIFGLGNRTYEHYNVISKQVDEHLTKMGATRIGTRGEGDDDKSMEEDYLEWKDGMWEAFARVMNVEEGQGGDTADFAVSEIQDSIAAEKVYRGMLPSFPTIEHSYIYDLVQASCLHAPSPGQRVFMTQRTHMLLPFLFPASCSRIPTTGIVFTWNSTLKGPV